MSADLDEDGWPDIYVACDSTPSLLLMNNHDGTFREEGVARGIALMKTEWSKPAWESAWAIAFSMATSTSSRRILPTIPMFSIAMTAKENSTTSRMLPHLGTETHFICWGTGIFDLDNDGYPDIFIVAGSTYPGTRGKVYRSIPNKCPRMIFRNLGNGTFEELIGEAGKDVAAPHSSRGCAFGDFDNDGDLDILIMNLNEAAHASSQRLAR